MAPKSSTVKKAKAPEYVTVERFNSLEGSVNKLVDLLEKQGADKTPSEDATVVPTAPKDPVKKANANALPVNPEWEEMAREIIGEALDHCELTHLKSGGVLFTVVIKDEFSNAGTEYLKWYKQDRRSKEIGTEGMGGVEAWCKLIKQNLNRPK